MSPSSPHHDDTNTFGEPIDGSLVAEQLEKILSSHRFEQSPRCAAFLKFVVEETLAGRSDLIKGPTIAISVFDRHPNESPEDDPIVRIQAGRVRKRLSQYYAAEGASDPIRISVPSGSYLPLFQVNPAVERSRRFRDPGRVEGATEAASKDRRSPIGESHKFAGARLLCRWPGRRAQPPNSLGFKALAVLAYWTTSQFRYGYAGHARAWGRENCRPISLFAEALARSDDRVRISIECVDVETGDQIWAERFRSQVSRLWRCLIFKTKLFDRSWPVLETTTAAFPNPCSEFRGTNELLNYPRMRQSSPIITTFDG